MDAYLELREPELAAKLLEALRNGLLTIHGELGAASAEMAQVELRIFHDQLDTYPEGLLEELRLRLQEAEVLGVREAVERHIRHRAAGEVTRLMLEAGVIATGASAGTAK
ncbi:hypothetical protein [Roseomonas populi]|uniref:Uncharacterized protein n=1 Tax=Roseomonas populi TaxID=3121582 RepID=A0ABT1XFE7_9PROT|nr:hypothetical protein [Roseomonas pecuniae]MCR0985862.1 hypothetical protein [Roseomonas pecuniae]